MKGEKNPTIWYIRFGERDISKFMDLIGSKKK